MATEAEFKKLAIKCIEDDAFRGRFEKNPADAARELGISLTPEEEQKVKENAAARPAVTSGVVSHAVQTIG